MGRSCIKYILGKQSWAMSMTFSVLITCGCAVASLFADAMYPEVTPRVMMITWDTFTEQDIQMYADNKIDTVFKALGATNWRTVEETSGIYDFTSLRNSLTIARDTGLYVIPTISLCDPPQWFKTAYPNSIMKYSDGTADASSPLSLAWLVDAHDRKYIQGESRPDYDAFENYLNAVIGELKTWDNVIGVALPWQLFAGDRFYSGTWDDIKDAPQNVKLFGFDTGYQQRWDPTQGGGMPATWQDYKLKSAAQQLYWQQWAEHVNGQAAKILLTQIHDQAPRYWAIIRKHIWIKTSDPDWMVPDLGIISLLNEGNFSIFLSYVKEFSSETGWKGVLFDNDAFMDSSKIRNSIETKQLVANEGFAFMGEGEIEDGWQDRLVNNIKTVRPSTFSFIPYPGQKGEHVTGEKEQEMIRLMRERPTVIDDMRSSRSAYSILHSSEATAALFDQDGLRVEYVISNHPESSNIDITRDDLLFNARNFRKIGFWLYGDNSGNKISLHLKQKDTNCWLKSNPEIVIDWSGWKCISLDKGVSPAGPSGDFINSWDGLGVEWDTIGAFRFGIKESDAGWFGNSALVFAGLEAAKPIDILCMANMDGSSELYATELNLASVVLSDDSSQKVEGDESLCVEYTFVDDPGKSNINITRSDFEYDLRSDQYISFWVYGDGSGNHINIHLKQKDSNCWVKSNPVVPINWSGWKLIQLKRGSNTIGPSGDFVNSWDGMEFDWGRIGAIRFALTESDGQCDGSSTIWIDWVVSRHDDPLYW